ncbi:MAG TPA: hypothetical protein VFQ76_09135 [Longimicrobiaceae bacterium]|nr:hypothetical protein [Longimicrobiaceae bacterium]
MHPSLRLLLPLVFPALAGCARGTAVHLAPAATDTALRHGPYTVEIQRDDSGGAQLAVIRRGGASVWQGAGFRFSLGEAPGTDESDRAALPPAVRDLTGDGAPELVLADWSGGAHCCFTYYVFTLGPRFAVLDTIPLEHSDDARFQDLDGDGALELRTRDWTFAYWNTSFMGSPSPEVVLAPGEDGWGMAERFARRPPLSADSVRRQVARVRGEWNEAHRFPPVSLWRVMVEMVYGGNAGQVGPFVECAWKGDATGREVFLRYFRDQLLRSPFYEELDALNGGNLYDAFRGEGTDCGQAA